MPQRKGNEGGEERTVPVAHALAGGCLGPAAAVLLYPASPFAAFGAGLVLALLPVVVGMRGGARTSAGDDPAKPVPFPEEEGRRIVDAIPEPALLIDRVLNLQFGNQSATSAFGAMALGEAVTLRFRSPEFLAAVEEAVASALPGKADVLESRSLGRTWSCDITPVAGTSGQRPAFFLLLFRDRTAERQIGRMRTDFVANASHELRTPLASVIGFIETLQGPAREDPAARDRFLAIMREQAARMSRLIDDLLSLSQIEMKRLPAPGQTVDLVELLHETRRNMAPLIEESGMVVELDLPGQPHLVEGARDELLQVFSNLVENACKYGASGGRLILSLRVEDEKGPAGLRASVRDFGPGIAAEHVPRLTERFYRANVESSRAKRGTGLGLSIVRNILLRHSARLVIESELEKGSTFSVVFPRRVVNSGKSSR